MDNHIKLMLATLLVTAGVSSGQDPVATHDSVVTYDPVATEDRISGLQTEHSTRLMHSVTATISQHKYSWRICYSGTQLKIPPFFTSGETWTPHKLSETQTLAEMKLEIKRLNLKLTAKQQEKIDLLEPVPRMDP